MRPKATAALGEPGISRFPREVLPYLHGVSGATRSSGAPRDIGAPDGAFRFS